VGELAVKAYQLKAPKLAVGDAIEKTVAVVKSAAHKRTPERQRLRYGPQMLA